MCRRVSCMGRRRANGFRGQVQMGWRMRPWRVSSLGDVTIFCGSLARCLRQYNASQMGFTPNGKNCHELIDLSQMVQGRLLARLVGARGARKLSSFLLSIVGSVLALS